jgi:hypothetical protein
MWKFHGMGFEKITSWVFVSRAARFCFVHFAQIVKHTPPSFCAVFTNRKKIKKILIFFKNLLTNAF